MARTRVRSLDFSIAHVQGVVRYQSPPPNKLLAHRYLQTAIGFGPLDNGTNYPAPKRDDEKIQKCDCNTVFYSLVVCCSLCQINAPPAALTYALNKSPQIQPANHERCSRARWAFWKQYCDSVYVSQSVFEWGWATRCRIGDPIFASCLSRFHCSSLVAYHHTQIPLCNSYQRYNPALGIRRLVRKCTRPMDISCA